MLTHVKPFVASPGARGNTALLMDCCFGWDLGGCQWLHCYNSQGPLHVGRVGLKINLSSLFTHQLIGCQVWVTLEHYPQGGFFWGMLDTWNRITALHMGYIYSGTRLRPPWGNTQPYGRPLLLEMNIHQVYLHCNCSPVNSRIPVTINIFSITCI